MSAEISNDSNDFKSSKFPCTKCGAFLVFAPGTHSLTCEYCGEKNEIETKEFNIVEEDFHIVESNVLSNDDLSSQVMQVTCSNCGASSSLPENTVSGNCPFCSTALIGSQSQTKRVIKPKYILPFIITKNKSIEIYKSWIGSHFWAPNDLKKYATQGKLQGLYIPFWTFDSKTETDYVGEKGINKTESYVENGEKKTRTHTDWYNAKGHVSLSFDDILVNASHSLPKELKNELTEWNLSLLKPYDEQFVSGFTTEIYQIGLSQAHEMAKTTMSISIDGAIRSDIGGDEQRINSKNTIYSNTTFKHILLPIWYGSYKFKEKTYNILINGQSGEIKGKYPVSAKKIITTIGICIGVFYLLYLLLKK